MNATLKFFFVLMTSAVTFSLSSCSEDPLYSCDPEVEAWTKVNINLYQSASRANIVKLPLERQQAVIRGISTDKKVSLWRTKFDYIMIDERLTDAEKNELRQLYDFVSPEYYDTKLGLSQLREFATTWERRMSEKYGWNEQKIFFYACTWMTEEELAQSVIQDGAISLRKSTRSESDNLPPCTCRYDSFCARFGKECKDSPQDCNYDSFNDDCGLIGGFPCDGICQ